MSNNKKFTWILFFFSVNGASTANTDCSLLKSCAECAQRTSCTWCTAAYQCTNNVADVCRNDILVANTVSKRWTLNLKIELWALVLTFCYKWMHFYFICSWLYCYFSPLFQIIRFTMKIIRELEVVDWVHIRNSVPNSQLWTTKMRF